MTHAVSTWGLDSITRQTLLRDSHACPKKSLNPGPRTWATRQLGVPNIQQEVAMLHAQRIEILGKANADLVRMEKDAEAKGYELMVGAFGGGKAYNPYTLSQNFKPDSIRLFFAGEGTFWTDLTRFEELGAAKLLQPTPKSNSGAAPTASRD